MGKLKICICSTHSKSYHELAKLTIPNHLEYAWKHGYDYNSHHAETKNDTVFFNACLCFVGDLLKYYDYILTVGVDVLFMNKEITIESIIVPGCEQQITWERIGGSEHNNDVMIWKNCDGTRKLIDKLLSEKDTYVKHPTGWQEHINVMIAAKDSLIANMAIVAPDVMNNIGWQGGPNAWKPGCFIAHFYCADLPDKIKLANEYLPKVI